MTKPYSFSPLQALKEIVSMLKTSSITNLNVEFVYLTVDFELNLNRSRLGLDLRAYKYRHLTFWVGILRNFNSFLFKENIK